MRTLLKSLTVAIALLSLPSCTAYMYEGHGHHPHHGHDYRDHESRFGVIGIAIARRGESGHGPLVVAHVLPGGPADQADVQPGDRHVVKRRFSALIQGSVPTWVDDGYRTVTNAVIAFALPPRPSCR